MPTKSKGMPRPAKDRLKKMEREALIADGIEPIETQAEAANTSVKVAEDAVVQITKELSQIEAERQQALASAVAPQSTPMLSNCLPGHWRSRTCGGFTRRRSSRLPRRMTNLSCRSAKPGRRSKGRCRGRAKSVRRSAKCPGGALNWKEPAIAREILASIIPWGIMAARRMPLRRSSAGFSAGRCAGTDLDRVLRDNYRYPVPRADPDFGGLWGGTPFPAPWGRSDSWSRNRGSGGWRTGGSLSLTRTAETERR